MKRILREPKFNTDSVPDTEPDIKPKIKEEPTQETMDDQNSPNTLDIHIIKTTPLAQLTRKPKYIIFAVIIAKIKKALVLKKYTNPTTKVLVEYYKNLNIFL